jgi:hypothetical protein
MLQIMEVHMMICKKDKALYIGSDLADCMTGKSKSHGVITIDRTLTLSWLSTQPIRETESALRKSVQDEGRQVTYFMSQAVD